MSITVTPAPQTFYATGESTTLGDVVAGSLLGTQASDGLYEALKEELQRKKSVLEHTWTFELSGGDTITFSVEAYRDGTEDDFAFDYSTDGLLWTNMVKVNRGEC